MAIFRQIDFYLFQNLNQLAGKLFWLDTLAIFFAQYFEYILIFSLFLFLFLNFKKYWQMIIQAILAAILARLIIVEIIRYFLPRRRPFLEIPVNLLLGSINQASFPSGHAAFYFAIATIVYFYNKKASILFFVGSFLIVLARVFVGVHWPFDILAGTIIGIFGGWFILFLCYRFFSSAEK